MSVATLSTPTFRVLRANSFDQLPKLAAAWNRLAGDVPFRRWEWCSAWWKHYAEATDRLFLLLVIDADGAIVGIAPWFIRQRLGTGRVVQFLGSGECCSDDLSLLAVPGLERPVATRIAAWLSCEGAELWDLLHLEGVAAGDVACTRLIDALRARWHSAKQRQTCQTWRVRLPQRWDQFVERLSRPRRRRIRNLQQRAIESGRAALRTVDHPVDLPHGLKVLRELNQRRRRLRGLASCFSSQRFNAFHADVARNFFDSGRLRLSWTELDGKPVAAQYAFTGDDTVYVYQSGFAPEAARESPGWLQLIFTFRHALAAGFRQIDFLRGDEPYKRGWKAEPTPQIEFHVVARHLSARLRQLCWRTERAVTRLTGRVGHGLARLGWRARRALTARIRR